MNDRHIYKDIWNRLASEKAMIMVAGPRQSGKTTFARKIVAKAYQDSTYFNWDQAADKQRLIHDPSFFASEPRDSFSSKPLVIFDEIHKYRGWKNYLKGVYDQYANDYQFMVTGSGRLEFSRKAGDSLAGRFLRFHIFPLTLVEFSASRLSLKDFMHNPLEVVDGASTQTKDVFDALWEYSGFPEPFFKARKEFWRTWSSSYGEQIVRDDLRTVADIRNLDQVEHLFALLPSRVGSPMSINNVAGDLQVAFDTVKNWLLLFDAFYLSFRVSPWTGKISRSILKEKKLYIFNYPLIDDEGARFENFVAVELLRMVQNLNDLGEGKFALHYLRNKDKQEVDFVLIENNRPFLLVETKISETAPPKQLKDFQSVLNIPAVVLVRTEGIKKIFRNDKQNILIITAHQWLASLP